MALNFSAAFPLPLLIVQALLCGGAFAVPQNGQLGYGQPTPAHVPILYEAYYPEPREWTPQASVREIERLRELTSQLLREEEQLGQLAAAAAAAEATEPRDQLLRYVFPGKPGPEPAPAARADEQLQLASLTISDVGPRKTRHHHGQANWLLRRLAA